MEPIKGAFELSFTAIFKIPDSTPRKQIRSILGRPCLKKPDIDNIMKSILDALQKNEKIGFRGAFEDDKRCAVVKAEKRWGLSNRLMVTITALEPETERERDRNDEDGGIGITGKDEP